MTASRKKRGRGRPPLETPRKALVSIRLTDDEAALADELAVEREMSRAGFVQQIVTAHLDRAAKRRR